MKEPTSWNALNLPQQKEGRSPWGKGKKKEIRAELEGTLKTGAIRTI